MASVCLGLQASWNHVNTALQGFCKTAMQSTSHLQLQDSHKIFRTVYQSLKYFLACQLT